MSLSILFVDDEPDILSSMGRILRRDGYTVDTAMSIAEATNRTNWIDYFAVLLDRKLPDGLSDDLVPKLKRLAPQAAIIVITAHADLESSLASLRNGVEDYLLKPIEPEALLHRLRRVHEMQQAEQRARQAKRLADIGEMMTVIAHESRNSLQRIQAAVEMARLEAGDNSRLFVELDRIQNASDGLHAMLDEIRNYAAPIKLDRAEATLPSIWREAWQLVSSHRKDRDVTLREESNGFALNCNVDRFRLVQVFRNLLENSLAACSDPVVIQFDGREISDTNGGVIEVTFRDSGPGLNEEQKQRIFEPFFTTKSKGTGLGMAIAQRVMEAHGGHIHVGDSDHPGAEFVIHMPQ